MRAERDGPVRAFVFILGGLLGTVIGTAVTPGQDVTDGNPYGKWKNGPSSDPGYFPIAVCDIVSFDIYPACHSKPEVAGKLWYVPKGVARLREWTKRKKPVWCCIECTHINNPKAKATARQVKAEVWMAITHGAQGLIYFSHQFKPKFIEAGLLADRDMARAVGRINRQIHALAPVINSPTLARGVRLVNRKQIPVHTMVKRPGKGGATYVFAVAMRPGDWKATFKVKGVSGRARVTVLGEDRVLEARGGTFEDRFADWDVHLYKIERK